MIKQLQERMEKLEELVVKETTRVSLNGVNPKFKKYIEDKKLKGADK